VVEEIDQLPQAYGKLIPYGLSPGQQVKVARETKALFNPENTRNRMALNENYNIQLPLIEKRGSYKVNMILLFFEVNNIFKYSYFID
jgi:hypothetical protein